MVQPHTLLWRNNIVTTHTQYAAFTTNPDRWARAAPSQTLHNRVRLIPTVTAIWIITGTGRMMDTSRDLVGEHQLTSNHPNDPKSRRILVALGTSTSDTSEESPAQTHTRRCPNRPRINRDLRDLRLPVPSPHSLDYTAVSQTPYAM